MHNILHPSAQLLQYPRDIRPDDLALSLDVIGVDDIAVCVSGPLGGDVCEGFAWGDDGDGGEEVAVGRDGGGGVDVFDFGHVTAF